MEPPNASSGSDQYDSGINPGNHGISFEKELAFVTFVAASLQECPFKLAAEMKPADKFDDVVLFNEESKAVWLFQAKHSKDGGQISFDDLFSTDPKKSNFAFCKYLQSYLKIAENAMFTNYKPTVFMFTNNSLDESSELKKWLNIRTQNVDSMIRWCDPKKYVYFEPLNDEAVSNITRIMNSELLAMKEDIEKLSKTGNASDLLVQYKAPLQNIMQISNGIMSFKEPTVNSTDFATHQWLLSEFKVKPNEGLCLGNLDDRSLRNLNSFFASNSRNKKPSVPRTVTDKDTREFFKHLIFCVEQPTDLRSVAEELTSCWMRRWVESDDLGQFGRDLAKLFQNLFDEVFDEWHRKTESPKDFLKFENEGSKIVKRMKTELKRKLLQKSSSISTNMSMYVRRTVIITKIKKKDDGKESQNIKSNGKHNLNTYLLDGRSYLQTTHVSDKEFMEHLNKKSAETKCQVLIAEPGMGKTTLISYLYSQLEQLQNVDVYLIRLKNLKVCYERKSDPLHIFQHDLSQESRNILLKDLENKEKRILFLLDGFDEMNPSYFNSVLEVIKNLMEKQNTQCIITGRNHVRGLLEDKLNVIALKLKTFDHSEQVKFLELFWKVNESVKPLFDIFSKQLLAKFHSEIKGNYYDFTGLPLMIRMLAEVYADDYQKFLETRVLHLSEKLNVLTLFENFVKNSFNIKMRKKDENTSNAYEKTVQEIDKDTKPSYDVFLQLHQVLAIEYLDIQSFYEVLGKGLKYVGNVKDIRERVQRGEEKSLLLRASSTNQIDFIHLSYAEYFVAKFIFDHSDEYELSLMGIFKNREAVRKFFLLMVEHKCNDDSKQMQIVQSLYRQDSLVAVWACLGGNEKVATKLLRKSGINYKDPNHQILLHAAAAGGSTNLIMTMLNELGCCVNYRALNFEVTLPDYFRAGDFAIHVAARKNNLEIVEQLVRRGAELDEVNMFGETPLHLAVENGHLEVVKFLIDKMENVDATEYDGETSLHSAAENGHLEVVRMLIEKKAKVNAKESNGSTPLHLAAENGLLKVVKLLIEQGANVTATSNNNRIPLHLAAKNGHLEVVELLIKPSAYVNATDSDDRTPLHLAAENGHLEVVKLLINQSANVNDNRTPFHLAAERDLEVEKWLKKWNPNVNTKDFFERKPLHSAAKNNNLVAKRLIHRNASVDPKDSFGKTPLHLASENGHLEVVELLIEQGANVNATSNNNRTSLHLAAEKGHLEAVKLLIKPSANVNATDSDDRTPLHLAAENGHFEVVKLLIEQSANVNATSNNNRTPLLLAAENGHVEVVQLLIKQSANVNDDRTPLHLAAEHDLLEVVKLLKKCNANVHTGDFFGRTSLHSAAKNNNLQVATCLIHRNANVDPKHLFGKTPLHLAAKNDNLEVLEMRIEKNANVHARDNFKMAPLQSAAKYAHYDFLHYFHCQSKKN